MKIFCFLGVLLIALSAESAEHPKAFLGARIIPIEGEPIECGTLLIDGDTILAVGPQDAVELPEETEQIDATGKVIMPGLICTHSHIGGPYAADGSGPIQPGVRVLDSLNVRDSGFKRALAGGLTSLNIMPGSGHLSSGQTVYVKLRFGGKGPTRIEDLLYRDEANRPLGGLKMANGTNSMRDAPFPGSRGKSAFLVREQYIKAREYHRKIIDAKEDPGEMPPRDLHLESLIEAMQGKRIVHHHTHRHDDIITVLRLSREFGFRVVLHHVSEGWKVADEIAAANVPCSMIMIDSPGGKLEARYLKFETGRILEEAGVRTAFHTDDPILDSRYFLRSAALAVRAGMSRKAALAGVTLAGAEMLDLQDRIGTLAPGKDADFMLLDGDPLSIYSKVQETWVEGVRVFDRSDPQDRLYAVGGYGAGHDQTPYFCCFDQANQGSGK
ncbi:MAG: amidohydrolase family protein [Pirellulaceae bacterium]|nr:amidohydrolase family protein [Pirellulaceae bacterium]